MIDATRSPPPGCELAALGRVARPAALLDVTVSASPPEAAAPRGRPLRGRGAGAAAAQTRQIAHWTREGVESIIQAPRLRHSPRAAVSRLGRMPLELVTAGESHGPALVAVVTGLPAGLVLDKEAIDED